MYQVALSRNSPLILGIYIGWLSRGSAAAMPAVCRRSKRHSFVTTCRGTAAAASAKRHGRCHVMSRQAPRAVARKTHGAPRQCSRHITANTHRNAHGNTLGKVHVKVHSKAHSKGPATSSAARPNGNRVPSGPPAAPAEGRLYFYALWMRAGCHGG